jgi:hypothetical protein
MIRLTIEGVVTRVMPLQKGTKFKSQRIIVLVDDETSCCCLLYDDLCGLVKVGDSIEAAIHLEMHKHEKGKDLRFFNNLRIINYRKK